VSAIFRRQISAEVRVLDAAKGLVEYVASDESIDSYREVIRADGWRFDLFAKNSPFVDSHQYGSVDCLLGQVVDFRVEGRKLVEIVQWAVDVQANTRARIGWDMTRAGYLKAVSVGFVPKRAVSKWDSDPKPFAEQLTALGYGAPELGVRVVYLEQQQIELSAVVIGANPNALVNVGKAYRAGVLTDADLQLFAHEAVRPFSSESLRTASSPPSALAPGHADTEAKAQERERFLERLYRTIHTV
jgi:hypothetical protein